MPSAEDIAFAETLFRTELAIESAGIFWIAAELAILFCVLLARFHVEHRPHQPKLTLDPAHWRRLRIWTSACVVLAAAVWGRHLVIAPLPGVAAHAPSGEALASAYAVRAWIHNGVWFSFINIWVILETVIVYHGWRTYRSLRRLFHVEQPPAPASGMAILVLCLALGAVAATGVFRAALFAPAVEAGALVAAWEEFAPLRDVKGLYLRLAGVVWITVEWIAAFYLWRGWLLLRHAAAQRGALADA